MAITVENITRQKSPATSAAGNQTFVTAVVDDDANNAVELQITKQTTPDAQAIANCSAASGVDVVTAPANSFLKARVGDTVTGDAAIPGATTVLAITPSPDGVADDSLQLSANTTGVISGVTLTFTGTAVTDPVAVVKVSFPVSGTVVSVATELYTYDGTTEGAAIDTSTDTPTHTAPTVQIDFDQFLLNQRLDQPT